MAIIITGNPGVGKHTVTKQLVKIRNFRIIDVNKIAKDNNLYEKTNDTNDVDTKKLKIIIEKLITKRTLLVGHLAPYVVSKNHVSIAIVLRRNPYELIKVYKKRKYRNTKIIDNAASEILGIIAYDAIKKFGKKKTVQIDCTKKTVHKVASLIIDSINGVRTHESVDWLSLVSEKNHLKKFFPSN